MIVLKKLFPRLGLHGRTVGALWIAVAFAVSLPAAANEPVAKKTAMGQVELLTAETYVGKVLTPRRGHAVVVNFWATWCLPCVKEMPEFQAAAEELAKEGIDVVLVSADGIAAASTSVPAFLKKRNVSLPVFVNENVDPEALIAVVDAKWSGALPYTAIYDADGVLVKALQGAQTKEAVIAAARAAQKKDVGARPSK